MAWYVYLLLLLSGMLLTNGVPHFVRGLCGQPFPSPFAKPPGIGDSSPTVNVYWGFANLAGGAALFSHYPPAGVVGWSVFSLGCLLIGTQLARHFGKVRGAAPA